MASLPVREGVVGEAAVAWVRAARARAAKVAEKKCMVAAGIKTSEAGKVGGMEGGYVDGCKCQSGAIHRLWGSQLFKVNHGVGQPRLRSKFEVHIWLQID